ncbi:24214_t:CDS:2, partial [Racocetra persica]
MSEEQNRTLEELRRFRFNWKPICRPARDKNEKRYPQNKDILESRTLQQITGDIWNTINNLINQINPTNNPRLGAILLTLEAKTSKAIVVSSFINRKQFQKVSTEHSVTSEGVTSGGLSSPVTQITSRHPE